MLSKLGRFVVVAVLALGLMAIAGCGGGDDKETKANTTEATPAATEDTGGAGAGVDPDDPQVKAAIDSCKKTIDAQAQLSDGLKDDLRDICDKAASGDPDEVRDASIEVCTKIAEEMVPEGSARDEVIASCKQATP